MPRLSTVKKDKKMVDFNIETPKMSEREINGRKGPVPMSQENYQFYGYNEIAQQTSSNWSGVNLGNAYTMDYEKIAMQPQHLKSYSSVNYNSESNYESGTSGRDYEAKLIRNMYDDSQITTNRETTVQPDKKSKERLFKCVEKIVSENE